MRMAHTSATQMHTYWRLGGWGLWVGQEDEAGATAEARYVC